MLTASNSFNSSRFTPADLYFWAFDEYNKMPFGQFAINRIFISARRCPVYVWFHGAFKKCALESSPH